MKKKAPLTIERHYEIGKMLIEQQNLLHELAKELVAAGYGKTVINAVSRVVHAYGLLRAKMDTQVGIDHPGTDDATLNHAYYPHMDLDSRPIEDSAE